jgi:drug/metabolite transporter (DMT)-like permease
MFLSPGMSSAGIASVLGNTQPLILVVLGAALLGERVTPLQVMSLVLGLAGVVLIALSALVQLHLSGFEGALFALASAVAFCLAAVVIKRLGSGVPLLAMASWQFLLGAIPLFVLSVWREGSTTVHWDATLCGGAGPPRFGRDGPHDECVVLARST